MKEKPEGGVMEELLPCPECGNPAEEIAVEPWRTRRQLRDDIRAVQYYCNACTHTWWTHERKREEVSAIK